MPIVICRCSHRGLVPARSVEQLSRALEQAGRPCEIVDDLCGLAAARAACLREWTTSASCTVAACFPRAVRWLLHAAGAALAPDARLVNLRAESAACAARVLGVTLPAGTENAAAQPRAGPADEAEPWFPVIDYDRCRHCGQCQAFCLFGVYSLSEEGSVTVTTPGACKNNCPACARICPQAAIMFPKLNEAPIRGDEVHAGTLAGARVRLSLDDLAGGDVYAALRRRRRLLRRSPEQKARDERAAFLTAEREVPSPDPMSEGRSAS